MPIRDRIKNKNRKQKATYTVPLPQLFCIKCPEPSLIAGEAHNENTPRANQGQKKKEKERDSYGKETDRSGINKIGKCTRNTMGEMRGAKNKNKYRRKRLKAGKEERERIQCRRARSIVISAAGAHARAVATTRRGVWVIKL